MMALPSRSSYPSCSHAVVRLHAASGAAGAMCSTVEDLIDWTRMLHAGEVVSPASLAAMTTPTVVASGDTIPYGFGLAGARRWTSS